MIISAKESKRRGSWPDLTKEQRTYLITSIWREGISAAEIGDAVGASKGAIIGHYFRNRDALTDSPLMMSCAQKHKEGKLSPATLIKHARENKVEEEEKSVWEDNAEEIYVPRTPQRMRIKAIGIPDTTYAYADALNATLFENTGCMWPVNDGGPYLFCGHAKFGKYSYCEHHHDRSRG